MHLLHLIFKLKNLAILLLLCAFSSAYAGERIDLLCISFSESDSIYQQQVFTLDSILVNSENPCIVISQPGNSKWHNPDVPHFTIFNPRVFSLLDENDSTQSRGSRPDQLDESVAKQDERRFSPSMIVSNFVYDSSHISFFDHYIVSYSDSVKVGFLGIVYPDLPHLVETLPPNSLMRFDIFECAKEMSALLCSQNASAIIALNYLGNFLNRELLRKVPQISFIIDTFEVEAVNHIVTDSILYFCPNSKSIVDIQLYISNGQLQEIKTKYIDL